MSGESGIRRDQPDGRESADPVGALADVLGAHAEQVADYCRSLLGHADEASAAAQAALESAQSLLADPDRLRAWLFALARQQVIAMNPGGAGLDYTPQPPPLTVDDPAATDPGQLAGAPRPDAVQAALRALPSRDRELLDLVYRHGIRPDDLPAVLWLTAEEAHEQLAAAEAELTRLAALQDAGSQLLSPLPGSFGSPVSQARRRVRLTAVATVPAAVIAVAVAYLAGPAQTVGSHPPARPASVVSPGVDAQTGTPISAAPGRSHRSRARQASGPLASPGAASPAGRSPAKTAKSKKPIPHPTSPSPSPTPTTTSPSPSPSPTTTSPSPSPSPTTTSPSPSPSPTPSPPPTMPG